MISAGLDVSNKKFTVKTLGSSFLPLSASFEKMSSNIK